MAAKVRLAGNKLCENALEVCSETEAVSDNTVNNELCGFQQVSHIDGNFQADVTSKIMMAKVRLAGNKLCENGLEVCRQTEAVPDNTMNDELFGFQQVSYIDGKFQADVISKIMTAKVRLAGNKLCENAPEVCSEAEAVSANVISDGFCDL